MKESEDWDIVIDAEKSSVGLRLGELWRFRDLLVLFVKRDIVATYKQTILGPLWFFIQPLLTSLTLTIVFGNIAGLSTNGYPRLLFYLSGITAWGYFAECLNKTSATFIANANLFSKVYFPRLIVPFSVIVSSLIRFLIQVILLIIILCYYNFTGTSIIPNSYVFLFPFLLILMAGLGLGFGVLISSITTKYRDFQFLVGFGVSLLMYLSPVIFPLSTVHGKMRDVLLLNPMTSVIETFRYAMLGSSEPFVIWGNLLYSFIFMIVLLVVSLIMFNRVQRSFMDTV